ncbi:uncharacterized protein G2W53_031933 [Senna tora]|uniref:Uncharacterized protein n=1 Tax=Senna tora TaxID=362788 RepID=A0A834SWT9_9FABA|nr:uncharacterized protein G2W53_031933 [Senna tora]
MEKEGVRYGMAWLVLIQRGHVQGYAER